MASFRIVAVPAAITAVVVFAMLLAVSSPLSIMTTVYAQTEEQNTVIGSTFTEANSTQEAVQRIVPIRTEIAQAEPVEAGIETNSVSGEEGSSSLTYQNVSRAEVINSDGTIQNPGGANNEDITLATTAADDETATRQTNLADMIIPQSTQSQEYEDFEIALQAAGYSIADMQYTLAHRTGVPIIVVRGLDSVADQPNLMMLEQVSAAYGYAPVSHIFISGAWETMFVSVTGN